MHAVYVPMDTFFAARMLSCRGW